MSDEKVVTFKFYEVQDYNSKIIVVTDDVGGRAWKCHLLPQIMHFYSLDIRIGQFVYKLQYVYQILKK